MSEQPLDRTYQVKSRVQQAAILTIAIGIALLVGLLILAVDGRSPVEGLQAAHQGTFGSLNRTANMVARIMLITLVGLAAAIPFSAGMWNIGGEGQLYVGAFAAALVGFGLTGLPAPLHLLLAIASAMLAGAVWAWVPAILKLRYKADEIVTTIMMNI